jgi:non-heme chloroperoxidase
MPATNWSIGIVQTREIRDPKSSCFLHTKMPSFTSPKDGTRLFYRYYEPDPAIADEGAKKPAQPLTMVFVHGWPMSSRMFDQLLVPLCEIYRFRCIAPDRRGFGNSEVSINRT